MQEAKVTNDEYHLFDEAFPFFEEGAFRGMNDLAIENLAMCSGSYEKLRLSGADSAEMRRAHMAFVDALDAAKIAARSMMDLYESRAHGFEGLQAMSMNRPHESFFEKASNACMAFTVKVDRFAEKIASSPFAEKLRVGNEKAAGFLAGLKQKASAIAAKIRGIPSKIREFAQSAKIQTVDAVNLVAGAVAAKIEADRRTLKDRIEKTRDVSSAIIRTTADIGEGAAEFVGRTADTIRARFFENLASIKHAREESNGWQVSVLKASSSPEQNQPMSMN